MITIVFPAVYPTYDGEMKYQTFSNKQEAERMIQFYASCGLKAGVVVEFAS